MKVLPLITLIIIACSGCKIGSHIAINPSKVDSSESSIKEIEELINDYNNAVIAKKYSKIDELTEVPFVLVNNDKTVSFSTKNELIAEFKRLREAFDESDYSHSEITSLEIIKLNDFITTAKMAYDRYNKSGGVFHSGEGIYLHRKINGKLFLVGRIESSRKDTL
tara:strand:+ start:32 stop:526 length:495 start_codon:yes stop_codon:yes gene_type:complete